MPALNHFTQAGRLRTRVQIEQHNGTTTARGSLDNDDANWAMIAEVWGSIRPLSGGELERAAKIVASTTHAVELRYTTGFVLSPEHRIRIKGTTRVLHIGRILNVDERNRKWSALATEELP